MAEKGFAMMTLIKRWQIRVLKKKIHWTQEIITAWLKQLQLY